MAGLLDSITGFFEGPTDPTAIDPRYGISQQQLYDAKMQSLGSAGLTLLAAGQRMQPSERAQLLAGLGNVPGQYQQSISDAMKQRLLASQLRSGEQDLASRDAMMKALSGAVSGTPTAAGAAPMPGGIPMQGAAQMQAPAPMPGGAPMQAPAPMQGAAQMQSAGDDMIPGLGITRQQAMIIASTVPPSDQQAAVSKVALANAEHERTRAQVLPPAAVRALGYPAGATVMVGPDGIPKLVGPDPMDQKRLEVSQGNLNISQQQLALSQQDAAARRATEARAAAQMLPGAYGVPGAPAPGAPAPTVPAPAPGLLTPPTANSAYPTAIAKPGPFNDIFGVSGVTNALTQTAQGLTGPMTQTQAPIATAAAQYNQARAGVIGVLAADQPGGRLKAAQQRVESLLPKPAEILTSPSQAAKSIAAAKDVLDAEIAALQVKMEAPGYNRDEKAKAAEQLTALSAYRDSFGVVLRSMGAEKPAASFDPNDVRAEAIRRGILNPDGTPK